MNLFVPKDVRSFTYRLVYSFDCLTVLCTLVILVAEILVNDLIHSSISINMGYTCSETQYPMKHLSRNFVFLHRLSNQFGKVLSLLFARYEIVIWAWRRVLSLIEVNIFFTFFFLNILPLCHFLGSVVFVKANLFFRHEEIKG